MFKKLKNIAIFTIISIYFIGMVISFFGGFLEHYQAIRQEFKIQKLENTTTLVFTEKEWNSFEDKKEFKHKNEYYDVISYQKKDNTIIIKAVNDSTENHFRVAINKVLKKHKKPISDRNKIKTLFAHISLGHQKNDCFKTNFIKEVTPNFNNWFNLKTKNFIFIIENPPC